MLCAAKRKEHSSPQNECRIDRFICGSEKLCVKECELMRSLCKLHQCALVPKEASFMTGNKGQLPKFRGSFYNPETAKEGMKFGTVEASFLDGACEKLWWFSDSISPLDPSTIPSPKSAREYKAHFTSNTPPTLQCVQRKKAERLHTNKGWTLHF